MAVQVRMCPLGSLCRTPAAGAERARSLGEDQAPSLLCKLHLGAGESRIRLWRARTESPLVRIPHGTVVLQNHVTIRAAARRSLTHPRP